MSFKFFYLNFFILFLNFNSFIFLSEEERVEMLENFFLQKNLSFEKNEIRFISSKLSYFLKSDLENILNKIEEKIFLNNNLSKNEIKNIFFNLIKFKKNKQKNGIKNFFKVLSAGFLIYYFRDNLKNIKERSLKYFYENQEEKRKVLYKNEYFLVVEDKKSFLGFVIYKKKKIMNILCVKTNIG